MSFICGACGNQVVNGYSPTRVVTAVREVAYHQCDKDGNVLKTTKGQEIVKEVNMCPLCARNAGEPVVIEGVRDVHVAPQRKRGADREERRGRRPSPVFAAA